MLGFDFMRSIFAVRRCLCHRGKRGRRAANGKIRLEAAEEVADGLGVIVDGGAAYFVEV